MIAFLQPIVMMFILLTVLIIKRGNDL